MVNGCRVLILVVVDDGLVLVSASLKHIKNAVLILVVVDDGLVLLVGVGFTKDANGVLILVVVDDGLVLDLIRHY